MTKYVVGNKIKVQNTKLFKHLRDNDHPVVPIGDYYVLAIEDGDMYGEERYEGRCYRVSKNKNDIGNWVHESNLALPKPKRKLPDWF